MSPNSSRFCAPALLLLTIDMEAQHTGVRGPLPVSALIAIPQQLAASSHIPVKDLIVPRIGHDEISILGPVKVSDEAGVTLGARAKRLKM